MPYDWVVFDADETLFTFDAQQGLSQLFKQYDMAFEQSHFEDFKAVNKPLWEGFQNGQLTAADIKQQRFVPWEQQFGKSSLEINAEFMHCMASICQTIEGTDRLLETLHGKTKMGIITNGFSELQQERLQQTNTQHYFDFLVVSEAVGLAKPDAKIFHHAHTQHMADSADPERILMVGDNPHSDILGGLNAGWHTCWFDRGNFQIPESIKPHHTITHLDQLTRLLS
ncbi:pyrimidine 5'-nucleotidase [Idiomarina seosinensis]|uniref:pyrimidine 5'-nucleotidase n=1 Tax=Idiomarina seosinensis TaxID=281739 RepID=UPI00384E8403